MSGQLVIKRQPLILVGLIAGAIASLAPGTIFIFLLAFISISLITSRCADEEEKRFIFLVFMAGFLSRVILCSFLHFLEVRYGIGYKNEELGVMIPALFGDDGSYSLRGWLTSQYLHGTLVDAERLNRMGWLFYESINRGHNFIVYTVFYYFFGFAQLSAKFINCLIGVLSAILVYFITKDVFNKTAAKIAAILAMFFPSIFLWSLTNLKESPMMFLLCLTIFASIRFNKYRRLYYIFLAFMGIYLTQAIRPDYIMPFLAAAFLSLAFYIKKEMLAGIIIIMIIAVLLANLFGCQILNIVNDAIIGTLGKFIDLQRGYVLTGGSTYKIYDERFYQGHSVNINPLAFFEYLPKGLIYFLFTPFPWGIHTKLQLIACPQIILWYILALFAFLGILSIKKDKRASALIALLYIFFITSALALSSGNIGTALRHRDIVLPLFFVFSAGGLERLFKRRAKSND